MTHKAINYKYFLIEVVIYHILETFWPMVIVQKKSYLIVNILLIFAVSRFIEPR